MKRNLVGKGLTVAVILLFLGLAIAPSIHAHDLDEERVECITEIYGMANLSPNKSKITKSQAHELSLIFSSIQKYLISDALPEETNQFIRDSLLKIKDVGIFPDQLDINEVQNFITGEYLDNRAKRNINEFIEKLGLNGDNDVSRMCIVSGTTTENIFYPILSLTTAVLATIPTLPLILLAASFLSFTESVAYNVQFPMLQLLLRVMYLIAISPLLLLLSPFFIIPLLSCIVMLSGLRLGSIVSFGRKLTYPGITYLPSEGTVTAKGLLGTKKWDGSLYGDISDITFQLHSYRYVGILGFTGIKINTNSKNYFIGFAPLVKITEDKPD